MKKIFFIIFLIVFMSHVSFAMAQDEDHAGFHVGFAAGGGIAVNDGALQSPAQLSLNLEVGYDFGNQLDIIGRFGYSPLIGTDDTVTVAGVPVTPPNTIHILNFDFGIRVIPFSARFSPYFIVLLGIYNSRSNAQGDLVFNSQTGFHNVSGLGVQYRAGNHHTFGFEIDTHFFINKANNVTSLVFSGSYRYTF